MSVSTRKPTRFVGGVNLSGTINDGNLAFTEGGVYAYTVFSGGLLTLGSGTVSGFAGPVSVPGTGHAVIDSGAGRLNTVMPHQLISGTAVYFYDSNVVAASGVIVGIAGSGLTLLAVIPANTNSLGGNGSMASGQMNAGPFQSLIGVPYYNGLAVSAASGTPGFTVTYTPSNEAYVGP